jgi:hypothetical protein
MPGVISNLKDGKQVFYFLHGDCNYINPNHTHITDGYDSTAARRVANRASGHLGNRLSVCLSSSKYAKYI